MRNFTRTVGFNPLYLTINHNLTPELSDREAFNLSPGDRMVGSQERAGHILSSLPVMDICELVYVGESMSIALSSECVMLLCDAAQTLVQKR